MDTEQHPVEKLIEHEYYFTAQNGAYGAAIDRCEIPFPGPKELGRLTFCVLVLKGGYLWTGESYYLETEEYDAGNARRIARENALYSMRATYNYGPNSRFFVGETPHKKD